MRCEFCDRPALVDCPRCGHMRYEPETRHLVGGLGTVRLTRTEAALLTFLMHREGTIYSPRALMIEVWPYGDDVGWETVPRAHMSNLRYKLRFTQGTDTMIRTIFGKGYRYQRPERHLCASCVPLEPPAEWDLLPLERAPACARSTDAHRSPVRPAVATG